VLGPAASSSDFCNGSGCYRQQRDHRKESSRKSFRQFFEMILQTERKEFPPSIQASKDLIDSNEALTYLAKNAFQQSANILAAQQSSSEAPIPPDEEYHSAWIAQRVPDGTVFVATNEFRIRTITPGDTDQIFSDRLIPGLKKIGWAPPDDPSIGSWPLAMGVQPSLPFPPSHLANLRSRQP
jgi:hypothetical protein